MGNVNMEAYQIHYKGNESVADKLKEMDGIEQDIEVLSDIVSIKADRLDIAPNFSEESAYSAGDLVYHSGRLWKFSVDHAAGAWDSSEVTAANIDMELSELKNTLTYDKVVSSQSTILVTNQMFIPTSDGLLIVQVLSGKHIKIFTKDGDGNLVAIIEIDNTSNNSNLYSFFIKKGMPLIKSSNDANGYITFRYLVS